jgi:tol-pal system protein YbgF
MGVYRGGQLRAAEIAFDHFARSYPKHDYADNALYWKGEAAYDQAHYADALAAFTEVVKRYGGGNKAPDALLKIGLCYGRLGDPANAKDVLARLVAAYPDANATRIAREKLAELEDG